MAEKLKERCSHALMALLLAAGLAVPLCGAMDASLVSPRLAAVIAAVVLLFELASVHRAAAAAAALALAVCGAGWIFAGNGARTVSDAVLAVGLRLRGIRTAVPLAAEGISVLTAALLTLLCCFATLRGAGCIPALILGTGVMMAVWLTDAMEMLPWLLPALAALLALVMTYRFDDTPPVRILPWTAALAAAAFLLSGIPPAENPVREKADEIRQAIMDRLFFTEARDVFSLYSVGLSPQGPEQLGGRPNPSDSPVMIVSTAKKAYLRGAVYNSYDGHGWRNTTGGRRYLWQSPRMAAVRAELFDETLPPASVQNSMSDPVRISVRMLSDSASTVFVPQRVRELSPGGEMVPYFSNSSEIFITRNLQAGDTYEVSAPLYSPDDPGIGTLADICATLGDPRWETIRNTYLELPSHLEQQVADLAMKVTSGAATPFEKAMALRNHLTRNYKYTLDVGEHPENIDFVTAFLFDTKKGYCTYFASAMTVLCRMAGLPARYVEGYLAEPDEGGQAIVTGLQAHAWTEVYFEGFGWMAFDATPGRRSGGQQGGNAAPQQQAAAPTPEPTPTPGPESVSGGQNATEPPEPDEDPGEAPDTAPPETPEPGAGEEGAAAPRGKAGFPWWILILLAVCAGTATRTVTTSPAYREKRAKTEAERFGIWEAEITKVLRAEQTERRPGETPMCFAGRVDSSGRFSESLSPAAECLSTVRYAGREPEEADTGLMRDTALLLRGEMTKRGRLRYLADRLIPGGRRGKPLSRKKR